MRIQHNIMAMNAYRNYNTNTSALSKNLEKLSSGYKINRAGDDAAGLAISEKMRAQITGLEGAQQNAKDGISLVQTAEGALTEVHDMLNRMYSLAEQSANGTYDNENDRKQLQKEVEQLRTEINRIADSANFNGIKLLDGNLYDAKGLNMDGLNVTGVQGVLTGEIGTLGTTTADGVLTSGNTEQKYSASFYIAEMTNNSSASLAITISYDDNTGTQKTVTLTVSNGATVSMSDIKEALTTGAGNGNITVTDSGTTAATAGDGGRFSELFDVDVSGNILTITAKHNQGGTIGGAAEFDGNEVGNVSITTNFEQDDQDAAVEEILEDYDGDTTPTEIGYGSAAGEVTAFKEAKTATYQVASTTLDMTGKTANDLHQTALEVGNTIYMIKNSGMDMDSTLPTDGATVDGKTVKYVEIDATDADTDIASKLAAAITASETSNGGYVASVAGGVLTISESTNRAQDVLDGDAEAGTAAGVAKIKQYTLTDGFQTIDGTIKVSGSDVTSGTKLTFGDNTYTLTNDASTTDPNAIVFAADATSEEIAQAIADKLTEDADKGTITATANADGTATITFAGVTMDGVNAKTDITSEGTGLQLQIGETSDDYNQLRVQIMDTHAEAIGIGDIDISNQKGAANALADIEDAINYISDVRGTLGATQNRLDHTINNLSVMQENIQDAESSIRDTDVAEEMMAYTKNNILIQSAQAMLAQANQVPQGVLQLLG